MTPIPLADLRLDWRSHRSALWWLWLLYRRPRRFAESSVELERDRERYVAAKLYLHQLPYMLGFCVFADLLILYWVHFESIGDARAHLSGIIVFHGSLIALGLALSTIRSTFRINARLSVSLGLAITGGIGWAFIVQFPSFANFVAAGKVNIEKSSAPLETTLAVAALLGFVFGIVVDWGERILGLTLGLIIGVLRQIARAGLDAPRVSVATTEALLVGVLGSIAFGLPVGFAYGISFGVGAGLAIAIGLALPFTIGYFMGATRAYYCALQPLFLLPTPRGLWYRCHPSAWDDRCSISFRGIDRLLVAYHEAQPGAAEQEISRLIDSYPSQRHQALTASTIILARRSSAMSELARLDEIVAGLPEGDKGFLHQTRRLREMVHPIAALQARLDTLDRPFLREPLARRLCLEIERFRDRVAGFRQPLAREFRAAAGNWLEVAKKQLANAEAVLEKEPTRQVFRAGDPVDREREAFVPRNAVSGEIERQVMLATGCPGIVLYGRRRTGKSTVLRNLGGFLPPQVLRANVSMQKPGAFTSLADLVATLTVALGGAVESLEPAAGNGDLRQLFRGLEEANEKLDAADRRLLLSIDEYENLDRKIGEGVFPEDLLATVRESIQTHRRITWIFAGSHEITELPSARWTSYLVSARTVEVEPFTAAETRLLLTEPLKHSKLWPKDDPTRPRFVPGFWGEDGIERIHAETGGWPHLVQLLAETVVDLLNDDQRSSADAEILERALDKAIVRGHTVLYELMRGESTRPGEWDYLAAFRARSTQPPPADEAVSRSLRRRLLVVEDDGGLRLRVPLMERWLRQRG